MQTLMTAWKLTATDLIAAYRRRELSPVEATKSVLARVEAVNPRLNALFDIRPDEALAAARASEERWIAGSPAGVLDGVPLTIKDSVAAQGRPYWRGTKARIGEVSTYDSPPAARLKEAGAVIFAKATMPDFGLLASGVSSAHGVTRNPWNLEMNTGGSSSGGAAAVASGMGALTIGTDLAGSVRLPAAHCGLFALKTSSGMVPHMPVSTTRVAGPITRTVADAALMLSVVSGHDPRTDERLGPTPSTVAPADLRGMKIGVLSELGAGPALQDDVAMLFEKAVGLFEAQGARLTAIPPPFNEDPYDDLDRIFSVRAAAERDELPVARRHETLEFMTRYCIRGMAVTAIEYIRANERLDRAKAAFKAVVSGFDLVLSPVMPAAGFPAEALGLVANAPLRHAGYTAMINQIGWPAAAICCGFTPQGLPVGLQIVGAMGRDVEVLAASATYERLRGFEPGFPDI
jgi:Asp-tRNA(Asn)/Glu-tRNA(Gln) amidotransferase A subunit family amidase